MRKNFLKVEISRTSEFVGKIVICDSLRILRINLQSSNSNSFQKNESRRTHVNYKSRINRT
ncbi:hypothetical protein FHG68_13600 [Leptospira weilii]|nr:hypothetical protein FHG67_08630 [Leptospira weilii]QDK27591.1 hypothetical protein FHG68_13600 [Leptospira weilii]